LFLLKAEKSPKTQFKIVIVFGYFADAVLNLIYAFSQSLVAIMIFKYFCGYYESVSSTQRRVGFRLGFFRKFRVSVGFGFLQHRFGLGSGFYFSKTPVFGWVLGFSKILTNLQKFYEKFLLKKKRKK
jgi:hypothetical protein